MKALTLTTTGGLEHLVLQDMPVPRPRAPDEVLVRLHAAALNRLDLFVADGLPGVAPTFPLIMGADGAGMVEAVGPAVVGFDPGDRVLINPGLACGKCEWCVAGEQPLCPGFRILGEQIHGTMAEYVVVPARNLALIPSQMTFAQAAAFPLATLTAWRMLVTRAKLKPGETILIWGIGGGVALAALKIARLLGARTIVTSSADWKLERARALGADVTLNHATTDVPREVRSLTERRGVNVVVDTAGAETWERSLRSLGRGGRLVTCGATTGPMVITDVRKLFWYQWSLLGSTMGNDAEFRAVTALAARGELWPEVDTVLPLDRVVEAYHRLASGVQLGKVVIEVRA
ncbi:MAG: zinc-binding dehydrogenase [Gemmatimonadales bacterium]